MNGSKNPLSDLFDVGKLIGKALVGDLTDADIRRRDTEPAPPPPPSADDGRTIDYCARCDGEREVAMRGKVVPCPVCASATKGP